MIESPAKRPFLSRRVLFWLAWLLLAASLLMPAPAGSNADGTFGISALYVFSIVMGWSAATAHAAGSLGFWPGAFLALALFSNIGFLYTFYLRQDRGVSIAWKLLMLGALAVAIGVALLVPDFARLPAYWIWVCAMAALALGYWLPGASAVADEKPKRGSAAAIDNGNVPPLVWVLLAFTLFWIAVSAVNHRAPAQPGDGTAMQAPLTRYVTDPGGVLTPDQQAQLGSALENFEKATSNQIAVAIYPHVPGGSVDDFTIGIAERSRLGRKGLDNGAILFLFMDQRTARMEVGYGLEGVLPDVEAHRILETQLAPAMAQGSYFDAIDITLGAVFNFVQDAYKADGARRESPGWWQRLKVAFPRVIGNAWPVIRGLGLLQRVAVTVLGSFIVIMLWSVGGQWGRLGSNVATGIGNLRAGRPFLAGSEKVDADELLDSLKALGWGLAGVVSAAGLIVLAAGGAYGGAGAVVQW